MMNIQWEILLLLVGLIVAVARGEHEIRKARADAKQEKSELENKTEKLDVQAREFFQTQYQKLADENKGQSIELASLKETVTKLKYELAEKQGEVNALKTELESLKLSHYEIKAELKQYQIENGQLISENAKLAKDKHLLRQQKESAEKLNKQYLVQIQGQSQKIEHLETQIKELDMRLRHNEGIIARQAEIIERLQNGKHDTQEIVKINDKDKTPVLDDTSDNNNEDAA